MSRSKGSKASHSKLANKKFNRLAKQGKLKKKKKKKDKEKPAQPEPSAISPDQSSEEGESDLDPDDMGFYSTPGPGEDSFIQTAQRRLEFYFKAMAKCVFHF